MAKIKQILYTPEAQQKTFLEKASDFVGTTALGKRLGGMLYSGTQEQKNLGQTLEDTKILETRLVDQINKNRSIGRDTSKLEDALVGLRKNIVQTEQAYKGLPTGGVTNKQVLGSVLQTASMIPAAGALAGVSKLATTGFKSAKAGRALSAAQGFLNTTKGIAAEGAVSGFLGGAGYNLEKDPRATAGSAITTGAITAPFAAGMGVLASKAIPAVSKKIGGAFAKYGSPKQARVAADAVADLNKALPPSGKKTVGSFLKDYTGAESSSRFSALQALAERNKGKMVKDLTGLEKEFDINNVKFEDLPMAYKNATESLYDDMLEELSKVGKGVEVDTTSAIKNITDSMNKSVSKQTRAIYNSFLNEIKDVRDPLAIRTYLSEIGDKVGGYLQTGTSKSEGKIAAQVYRELESSLNNFFAKEQLPIKGLYDQYSALKKLEFDITKAISKSLRDAGQYSNANLFDDYGLAILGSGIAYANPAQSTKGLLMIALNAAQKYFKNPELALTKAFQGVEKWSKIANKADVAKVTTDLSKKKLNEGFSRAGLMAGVAGVTGVGAVSQIGSKETFEREDVSSAKLIGDKSLNDLKKEIAYRETRGESEPYSAKNKNSDGTYDLGKYQVNQTTLAHWAPKLFGKEITEEQFLGSSDIQEKFFERIMMRFANEYKITDPEVAYALWHDGWGGNLNKSDEQLKAENAAYINT